MGIVFANCDGEVVGPLTKACHSVEKSCRRLNSSASLIGWLAGRGHQRGLYFGGVHALARGVPDMQDDVGDGVIVELA